MVAEHFGLATILGAFLAGVIVRRTDESPASQEEFQGKLEAIGFGFLIPVFFVSTGVGLDIASLFHSTRAIIDVPIFLIALLAVRGVPALLYVRAVGRTRAVAAGFMQATSLTFIVVATTIGVQTGHQRTSTAAALVRGRPAVGHHLPAGRIADAERRRGPPGVTPLGPPARAFLARSECDHCSTVASTRPAETAWMSRW